MLISPGVLKSSFNLLSHLRDNDLTIDRFVNPEVPFDIFGNASRTRVLQLCQGSQWIEINENGLMIPSEIGADILEQESRIAVIRRQLRAIIFHTQPPWAKKIQYGRYELLKSVSPDVRQCFEEAGLSDGTDEDTVIWWDILAQAARGNLAEELLTIGRLGERLSLDFERERTGIEAKYIALESSFPGYDILSIVSKSDDRLLCIEVKASTKKINYATFHLTRNEFNQAIQSQNYVFHLWLIGSNRNELLVCTIDEIVPHCPINQGSGQWESVEIPFNVFDWS